MWCIYKGPLEKEMATHSRVLSWKIPWTEGPGRACPWGHKELDMTEHALTHGHTLSLSLSLTHTHTHNGILFIYKKEGNLGICDYMIDLEG